MNTARNSQKGFGMVEIIVGAALILVIGGAAVTAWTQYLQVTTRSTDLTKAALLTDEAGEALVMWRDIGWTSEIAARTIGTTYYLSWNGTSYSLGTTAVAFQDGYAVKLIMSAVSRDGSSNVVTSGGTVDANTRKVQINVVPITATSTVISTSELLLHNVYSN